MLSGSDTPTLGDDDVASAATDPGPCSAAPELEPGEAVGRYMVLGKLGEGGMGVVYAAYDPELDRKVAVKVLGGKKDSESMRSAGRARLLREAQALAKLSHPNVVAIHDVGTHAGDVFIAMEFVEGTTLGQWLKLEPRACDEIVRVLVGAGRGLAAAHAAGLVHRDLKPDNVMIDGAGRARVLDFGLARAGEGVRLPTGPDQSQGIPAAVPMSLSHPLTVAGAWLGTPAYMAPEQFAGDPCDHRTDQFGFCVTMWQALYGIRPFPGHDAFSLSTSVLEGRFAEVPGDRGVPGFVRRALVRGLASRPDDRWPAMEPLLDELQRDRNAQRRRITAVGALAAGALVLGLVATGQAAPCADGHARLDGVWTDDIQAELATSFDTIGVHAADTWQRVELRLAGYADAWVREYAQACAATRVHQTQSERLLDLRMACLDDRRRGFGALVDVLRAADASTVERAIDAAATLSRVEACGDLELLEARVQAPTDPALAQAVGEARAELQRIAVLAAAGKDARAREDIAVLRARVEVLDHPPLHAEVLHRAGLLEYGAGDPAEAVRLQKSAYFRARAAGHDEVARDAAISLVLVLGTKRSDLDAALEWGEHARAELARCPADGAEAELETSVGSAYRVAGRFEDAERHMRRALELTEPGGQRVNVLTALASALSERGATDEVWELYRESIALAAEVYGPDHPRTALVLHNYASARVMHGEHDEALEPAERAVAIWRAVRPGSPSLGEALTSLGLVHLRAGRHGDALRALEESREITEAVLGPHDQHVAKIHGNLGLTYQEMGDARGAAHEYEAAHEIFVEVYGAEHPLVGMVRSNLGIAYEELGDREVALGHSVEALRILEAAFGSDDPRLADTADRVKRLRHAPGVTRPR